MAIPTTQSFDFEGRTPNFLRDEINSTLFENQDLLNLSTEEAKLMAEKYDIGHIVWDVATRRHYIVESKSSENGTIVGNFRLLGPVAMTTQEWYDLGDSYIPAYGEIIVFTDYKTVNEKNIPTFKVGDGTTNPTDLPFSTMDYAEKSSVAEVAKRLEHKLTIGEHEFDGSSDVEIEKYNGENIITD